MWTLHQDKYLDDLLHLKGHGYAAIYSTCGGCQRPNLIFCCKHQTCLGPSLYCQVCIVAQHSTLPTHWIQVLMCTESSGACYFVIQLGHPVGYSCLNPLKAIKMFVVIDVTGVHNVDVNFCQCDGRLEKWQQLMQVSWWPATVRDHQICLYDILDLIGMQNCTVLTLYVRLYFLKCCYI
ncbi:hypothetical protein B0H14DRAFT_2380871 [Mycena olivaceomarginata]|nr:hypothetical protein B0H14DRAFT_2380871 [Mycena olivaceomarginata]